MRKAILLIIGTLFFIGVNGQTTSIPDANFEQALINLGLDAGVVDGIVLTANIDTVTVLNLGGLSIAGLTGIEDFTALTDLGCGGNQLTSLDVTQNIALQSLLCVGNQLVSLDVSQNTSLTVLVCADNQLTSLDVLQNVGLTFLACGGNLLTDLDVSQNFALQDLECPNNQLTSLDVTQNMALTSLNCVINQLISLDISQNGLLTSLHCHRNQLTNLDITQNPALIVLNCHKNQLVSLDVSLNTALGHLVCDSNQLNCLNVKNGNNLNFNGFGASGNPSLSCVEVDDAVWSTANWTNIDAGVSFGINCPSDCSPVGIDEGEFVSGFSIYPNPASNNVNVEFDNEEQLINLSIINIHGQQVLSNEYENTDGIRLNVADLSSGIYFVKIIINEGGKTVKFIKE